ncbi:unnamed protein product [Rotaria magnacalcarata]
MVKAGKKTTTRNSSDKNKDNAVMFLLVRDIVSHTHHIVPRSAAITSKKIEKLEAGDEVSFGIRNKRSRCVILMIGWRFKKKNSKTHEKKPIEDDSEVDSTNNGEAHESTEADSEEEASSDQENEVLRINEEQSSNVIHSLNSSSSSSSSQSAIPKETESDKFAQKRKVPLEDDCSESATKCARNSYKGVSRSVHDALQRKVDSLDAQLLEYQTSWMPRPTDKATIDYFIDIGRVLSGEAERTNDDKSDLLTNIMDALDLTEQQLEKCIGKNIRITARRIMKAKYPSPVIGFKFADVDKDHISAARDYARLMHPREEKFCTDGDLNHAMGNVFAVNTHKTILKHDGQALHQREANTIDISRAIGDDIIDVSTISINESIDYPIDDKPNSNTSTFLNDAMLNIEQIKCNTSSTVTEKDIACALILLKKRHRLSARCMDDIISLLRTLSVKNVPSSWYKLKKILTGTISSPAPSFICPECEGISKSNVTCSQCSNRFNVMSKPNSFLSSSIKNQIERILRYNRDVFSNNVSLAASMKDICDGAVYQKLQAETQDPFITLTLNADGIQPHPSSVQTIWPILLVIDEIPLKRRFDIENIILAGVWPGPKKPTRIEMSLFLRPLIDELLNLERGEHFDFHDQDNNAVTARVFLIGACCDKPAQVLLQFLSEPTAAFGCGRCEVKGFMVKTAKDGNVRSFATTRADLMEIERRSNMRLCTRSYATNKIADDSNIIFLLDGIEYPGRIRAIFTLDNDEPYLLVAYLRDLNPLTCAINVSENFAYPNILYTSTSKQNFTPIEVKDFIEKSTFFRSTADISYFLRFPTLEHCS